MKMADKKMNTRGRKIFFNYMCQLQVIKEVEDEANANAS